MVRTLPNASSINTATYTGAGYSRRLSKGNLVERLDVRARDPALRQ
jgi:hypothetical protein